MRGQVVRGRGGGDATGLTEVRLEDYRGVGPEGAFAAVAAGGTRGACVLTEVVVAGDGLPAEVAHEAPAPARHPVAALRLDQACAALDTLPHTSCCHAFLTETQEQCFFFFCYMHFLLCTSRLFLNLK